MAEKKKKAANPAITAKAATPAKAVSLPGRENAAGTDAKPAVNFSDPKYFTRRFKKYTGVSPRAYRNLFA